MMFTNANPAATGFQSKHDEESSDEVGEHRDKEARHDSYVDGSEKEAWCLWPWYGSRRPFPSMLDTGVPPPQLE